MQKFEIIDRLEGRFAPTPSGKYHKISNGKISGRYGSYNILNHSVGTLEIMLRQSITQKEVNQFNEDQINLLMYQPNDALAWFASLTPSEQLAQIEIRFQDWCNTPRLYDI